MKKLVLISLSFVGVLILSGCGGASPRALNGKYYMAGDSNCVRYRIISDSRVMCMDADGRETGYRNAMSDQELQMYRFNQSRDDAAWSQLNYNNQQQLNRNAQYLRNLGY